MRKLTVVLGFLAVATGACAEVVVGWDVHGVDVGDGTGLATNVAPYAFAATTSERQTSGDPRPSIAERYTDRAQYLGLVAKAAMDLIDEGYLLGQDLPEILKRAETHWDYRHAIQSGELASPDEESACTISRMGKECGF